METIFTLKTFLKVVLFIVNTGMVFIFLMSFGLTLEKQFIISILFTLIYTTIQLNQVKLENKIFELKEKIDSIEENKKF